MASAADSTAFNELTNSPKSSSPSFMQHPRPLRRTKSLIFPHEESLSLASPSESEITRHIYNAERVSSNENLPLQPESQSPLNAAHDVRSAPSASLMKKNEHGSASQSQWTPGQLQSIRERRSNSTNRNLSLIFQRSSISHRDSLLTRKQPVISNIPIAEQSESERDQNNFSRHLRSFSLNDLDCLNVINLPPQCSESSPESNSPICSPVTYPIQPREQPPALSPTPPGLASFRTREAQAYRLTAPNPPGRVGTLFSRLLGREDEEEVESTSPADDHRQLDNRNLDRGDSRSPPMDMFRRMLGMSRMVNAPSSVEEEPRIGLPLGVRIADDPGILTIADDGTAVRGRFSGRASGHGVGMRPLENHPFMRGERLDSLEEGIRAIDKKYAMMAENNAQASTSAEPGENATSSHYFTSRETEMINVVPVDDLASHTVQLLEAQRRENQVLRDALLSMWSRPVNSASTSISIDNHSPHLSRLDRESAQYTSPRPMSIRFAKTHSPRSIRSPEIVATVQSSVPVHDQALLMSQSTLRPEMIESHRYATPSTMSSCHDNTTGFSELLRRGERDRALQQIKEERQKESRCTAYWEKCWSWCCISSLHQ